ncbi:hypothetical protein H8B15_06840 [Hymenobacter sp. BT507]|uniref:Uncharacterized protein n=1 Tax=Hymenobacter citatus TaxID=2763506 RepID=A0ABR7MHU8_9BACT|nr:hypothetical protein [Hymenobacter citatus]MBC6610631.1 hypothetical protein [Hymenobacter citatus]
MRPLIAFSCLLLTSACYQQSSQYSAPSPLAADTTTAAATTPLEAPDTARAGKVSAQSDTLKVVQKRHDFSTPSIPDVFRLVLRGQDVLSGQIDFTITDHTGQVIFHERLSAADLEASMVYDMAGTTPPTPGAREAYVRRRMDDFFADKNFHQPALPSSTPFPAGNPLDRDTWADVQRRADAIGFQYLVGKEDRRRIAYSPLKKQVVQLGGFGS